MATKQSVIMETRARIAPCTHRDRNTLPSPVVLRRFPLRRQMDELVEREADDLTEPRLESRVIRTVCDSSSSIRWPRLSVTW